MVIYKLRNDSASLSYLFGTIVIAPGVTHEITQKNVVDETGKFASDTDFIAFKLGISIGDMVVITRDQDLAPQKGVDWIGSYYDDPYNATELIYNSYDADLLDELEGEGYALATTWIGTDINDLKRQGLYRVDITVANLPEAGYFAVTVAGNGSNVTSQTATHYQNGNTYTRAFNTTWTAWKKTATTTDIGAYLPLAGGTMSGDINMGDNNITNVGSLDSNTLLVSSSSALARIQNTGVDTGNVQLHFNSDPLTPTTNDHYFISYGPNHTSEADNLFLRFLKGSFGIQNSTGVMATFGQDSKISLLNGTGINEFSIDGTLTGNSDDAVPTEKAVKTYLDTTIGDYLPLAGGTMSGNINMDSNDIINVGRVGIGTTSPKTKLEVSDAIAPIITLNSEKDGTWVAGDKKGGVSFYGNDSSGSGAGEHAYINAVTTDTFGVATKLTFGTSNAGGSSAERMVISNTGNVGIGITSPLQKLDVRSTSTSQSINVGAFNFEAVSNYGSSKSIMYHRQDANQIVVNEDGVDLTFRVEGTAGGNLLNVDGGENKVGIGVAPTSAKLDINGDTLFRNGSNDVGGAKEYQLKFGFNNTDTFAHYIRTRHSGDISDQAIDFYTGDGTSASPFANATHGMSIVGGDVGIGTTSPNDKLHLTGGNTIIRVTNTTSNGFALLALNGDTTKPTINEHYILSSDGSRQLSIKHLVGNLGFYNASGEYFTATQDGKVGIGTTSPSATLEVNGTTSISGSLNMNSNAITGVTDAVFADDAVNLGQMITVTTGYLPLTGGAMSGNIGRSAFNSGFLVGGHNNIGVSSAKTNPIFTIGSDFNPLDETLDNMYGIGFTSSFQASFVNPVGDNGWGMYVAAAGVATIFLNAGDGNIEADGIIYSEGHVVPSNKAKPAGWVLFGSGSYYSKRGGIVYLRGFGGGSSGNSIGTLPAEFRPANDARIAGTISSDMTISGSVFINASTGLVTILHGGAGIETLHIDGISFPAEQ